MRKSTKLNESQLAVVAHKEGPAAFWAVAGSGKTTTVVARMAKMILEDGENPEKILATTFTKNAANEMNERLEAKGVQIRKKKGDGGARVGTFHSLSLEIVRDGSSWEKYDIDAKDSLKFVLKDILGWKGMNWKGADLTKVQGFISKCKNELIKPYEKEKIFREFGRDCLDLNLYMKAYQKFEQARHRRGLMSFDDMLSSAVWYLTSDENAKQRWMAKYEHVIVDEYQDSNTAQFELVRILAHDAVSLLVVGDDDQCQPPGTLVQVRIDNEIGYRKIENIKVGERVRVFNKEKVTGTRVVKRIANRPYVGLMRTIFTDNEKTRMTPNHKVPVRWSSKPVEMWVCYLMRKENNFRIGWCQMFNSEGAFHLGQRARLEKADAAWILSIHNKKADAVMNEIILSLRYGISTICFRTQPTHILNTVKLKKLFNNIQSNDSYRVDLCFLENELEYDCPMWPYPSVDNKSKHGRSGGKGNFGSKTFRVFANNIIPKMMQVFVEGVGWSDVIGNSSKKYEGNVYSLEVGEYHNYVADNIVVNNCIYQWRGSKPEYSTKFEEYFLGAKMYFAEENYRSTPEILAPANVLVARNQQRVIKTNKAQRKSGAVVEVEACGNMDEEAERVLQAIQEKRVDDKKSSWSDNVILYRTNAQSRAFEEVFIKNKIPHVVLGGTNFYARKEVKDILSYLELAVDGSDKAFKRAVNRPFRFIGKVTLDKLQTVAKRSRRTMLEEAKDSIDCIGLQRRQVTSIAKFLNIIDDLKAEIESDDCRSVDMLLQDIIDRTNYLEWVRGDEGTDTAENSRVSNLKELVRTSSRFETAQEMLGYISDLEAQLKKKTDDGQRDVVLLMTIHKSKGLEWKNVFVAGMAQGILPHANATEVEEERRLAYVAMTRAKDSLMLTYPVAAMISGKQKELGPSQFLNEAGLKGVS